MFFHVFSEFFPLKKKEKTLEKHRKNILKTLEKHRHLSKSSKYTFFLQKRCLNIGKTLEKHRNSGYKNEFRCFSNVFPMFFQCFLSKKPM
jgi:hypothetical protein